MEKIGLFDFLTILLPGSLMAIFIAYLFNISLPSSLDNSNYLYLVFIIPIGYLLGHFISYGGNLTEGIIDRSQNKKHPLIEICKDGIEKIAIDKIKQKFIDIPEDRKNDLDYLFDIGKNLIYQQSWGANIRVISISATFYRNLVAWFIAVFLIILLKLLSQFACNHTTPVDANFFILSFIICGIGVVISRIISQHLYKKWFIEVLKNLYTFLS